MAMTEEEKAAKAEAKAKATAEKKAAAEEAKAKKAEEKRLANEAKAAAKPTKEPTVKQNGIARPTRGVTLTVWDAADAISAEQKRPAERKEVVAACAGKVDQVGTIHTQYGRWRKFHGLVSQRGATEGANDSGTGNNKAE